MLFVLVVCCLLFGAYGALLMCSLVVWSFVVCCSLRGACCSLFVVCCSLFVVCCVLLDVR